MTMPKEIRSLLVEQVDDGPDRQVTVTFPDDKLHQVAGHLVNELVIHPDGGIYLKLFLRPARTPNL